MIARLQRWIAWGLLSAVVVWLLTCAWFGAFFVGTVGALVLVFGYGGILAVEFVFVAIIPDKRPGPRATTSELVRAWLGEMISAPKTFLWRQPFREHAVPDALPAHRDGRRGIVLVHGFVCNRAFWTPWMRRLQLAGTSFCAVSLDPAFAAMDAYVQQVDIAVSRVESATGVPPVVVAHSMGGLVVRRWLQLKSAADRVHRVITIGTPHGGTWLARFSRTVPGVQMAINSDWLAQLNQVPSEVQQSKFICFYGNADNVVFPASCGRLQGADNRLVKATAHVQLAFHEQVYAQALRSITEPAA